MNQIFSSSLKLFPTLFFLMSIGYVVNGLAFVRGSEIALEITQSTEIAFVANDDELNAILDNANKGVIGSVAIAERFYKESTKQTQERIRGLIARMFELGNRAVYVYGQPLDVALASELLDTRIAETNPGCSPAYFWGKLMRVKYPAYPAESCGSSGRTVSEEVMREKLREQDIRNRKTFLR